MITKLNQSDQIDSPRRRLLRLITVGAAVSLFLLMNVANEFEVVPNLKP